MQELLYSIQLFIFVNFTHLHSSYTIHNAQKAFNEELKELKSYQVGPKMNE